MKKYLIKLSGITDLEFSVPVFTGKFTEKLAKLLLSIGSIAFFLFIYSLSISQIFTGKALEQSSFETVVFFMCITAGFLLSFIVLVGKRVLVDPKFFLSLLFFALLTTATSVLKSPAHITNTFGIELLRSLSGVSIMAIVGFYFFFYFIVRDYKMLKRVFLTFTFSLWTLIVITIFHTNIAEPSFVNNNLAFILFAYCVLLLNIFVIPSRRILRSILLGASAIFVFLTPQDIPDSAKSTTVIVTAILAIGVVGIIFAYIKKEYVKAKFIQIKSLGSSTKDKKYSISEVVYFLLLAASVIAVIIGVFVHFRFSFATNIINAPVSVLTETVKGNLDRGTSAQVILLGGGSYNFLTKGSNLNTTYSSVANIYITQGLVGLLAYIFILVVALRAMFKAIKKSLETKSSRGIITIASFMLVFSTIYSVLAYAGEYLSIIWWFAFVTFAVYLSLENIKKVYLLNDWSIKGLFKKVNSSGFDYGMELRVVVSLLIVIASILILFAFTRLTI